MIVIDDVFFYHNCWVLTLAIKLKSFFIFFLYCTVFNIHKKWLSSFLDSFSANFMVGHVSSGLRMLLILLFVVISSFTGRFLLNVVFLSSISLLIFGLFFVNMSGRLSVILTLLKTILREFVLVGFVFLLSVLFFWNFGSVIVSFILSMHSLLLPLNPCATTVLSLWISTMPSRISSLGVPVLITAVVCILFLRFHGLLLCLHTAVASSVALVLPTKLTGISFPSVTVSVTMKRFVSVLPVLIYLLMMTTTKNNELTAAGGAVLFFTSFLWCLRDLIVINIRVFSMISQKKLNIFRLSHLIAIHIAGVGPSRIDDTKFLRRGADA